MMRRLMLASAFVLGATAGQAAEAIEGNWKSVAYDLEDVNVTYG